MNREQLNRAIDKFLEDKSKSSNGYAPVKQSDIGDLAGILDGLIRLKYEDDPDGDRPIEFKLVDRTKFERMNYFNLPYIHEVKTRGEMIYLLGLAIGNMQMASEKVSIIQKHLEREDLKK